MFHVKPQRAAGYIREPASRAVDPSAPAHFVDCASVRPTCPRSTVGFSLIARTHVMERGSAPAPN